MELNALEIRQIIPHRFPFLLIDKVLELEPNEKLIALKNVTVNEPFFVGHFPATKVMPGVLIIEAMAQAGCVFFYYSKNMQGKDLIYFLAKASAKFRKPVVPGDQLILTITSVKMMGRTGILKAVAQVDDQTVAEAELGFGVKEV